MRLFIISACLFFCGAFFVPPAHATNGYDQEYLALIEKALKSDINQVDFLKLRMLYTETSFFDPYHEPAQLIEIVKKQEKQKKVAAVTSDDTDEESSLASNEMKKLLMRHFAHIDTHEFFQSYFNNEAGQKLKDFHMYVQYMLVKSIIDNGDGKTPDTAYVVIDPGEEKAITRAFVGLKITAQRLERHGNQTFDVYTLENPKTGMGEKVYFNNTKYYNVKIHEPQPE